MIQLLVINDDKLTTGLGMHCGADFEVSVADSPLAAFNSIIHINPDAIVMHTGNGFDHIQVLRRIRNMQASKYTPVLVIAEDDAVVALGQRTSDGKTDYRKAPMDLEAICHWAMDKLDVSDESGQRKSSLSMTTLLFSIFRGSTWVPSTRSRPSTDHTTCLTGSLPTSRI